MATSGTSRTSVDSSAPNHEPRAIFLLHKVPVEVDEDVPDLMAQIAATSLPHLKAILDTPLNYSGKVQTIYVNFFLNGLYEFHKPAHPLLRDLTPQKFEGLIREMFETGRLVHPITHEEIARRLPDMTTLHGALPRNCGIIGIDSGPHPYDCVTDLEDFVKSIDDDIILLFVVGDLEDTTVRRNMIAILKISMEELPAATCLGYIVNALALKWNIRLN